MDEPRPLWRLILWVERFLPKPQLPVDDADNNKARRRRLFVLFPLLVYPFVILPMIIERHNLHVVWKFKNTIAQLMLIFAACVAIAAFGFGFKAWREAGETDKD